MAYGRASLIIFIKSALGGLGIRIVVGRAMWSGHKGGGVWSTGTGGVKAGIEGLWEGCSVLTGHKLEAVEVGVSRHVFKE